MTISPFGAPAATTLSPAPAPAPAPGPQPPAPPAEAGRRRGVLFAGLGVLALAGGGALALVMGLGPDEAPLSPVAVAAQPTASPTTSPTTSPTDAGPSSSAGTPRNVFAALVVPSDGDGGGGGALVAGTETTAPVGTSAPVVPTASTGTPLPTSTGGDPRPTATMTVTAVPATGVTVLWTGTTAGASPTAELFVKDGAEEPVPVSVVTGDALGTSAPLSWVVSEGVDAEGRLVLRAGDEVYRLVQGEAQTLF